MKTAPATGAEASAQQYLTDKLRYRLAANQHAIALPFTA